MKKISRIVICLALCAVMLFSTSAAFVSNADGTHGFYMTCDSSVTDGKSDGFMIDFYSDSDEALCTYWSNANWSMYTLPTVKKYKYMNFEGGGAYAGLQIRGTANDRTGIMSMWRYQYKDLATQKTKYIYAKALYGKTTTYDNEGSGTSCVMPFDWKSSQWYRELLYCWEDAETGNTFIGTWFYDYEADKWTLFAYYNTFLIDSYIQGDIGQFLENYVESTRERYRSFRYRNIYFLSHENGEWISSPRVDLRSDANPKAHGEAKLGVSDDGTYVWASVDGRSAVDTDGLIQTKPVLVQEKTPEVGKPSIETFKVIENKNSAKITWKMADNSTPQLSYKLVITDGNGKEILSKYQTRPEVVTTDLENISTDNYKCEITVTDVFGQTATASYTSKNYSSEVSTPTKQPEDTITSPEQTTKQPQETGIKETEINEADGINYTVIIIAASAVGVIAVALVVVFIIIGAKKKNINKQTNEDN